MICTKCGLEIDAGAAFCGNCGQPVQATTPAPPMAPAASTFPASDPAQPLNPGRMAVPSTGQFAPAQPAALAAAMPGPAYGVPGAYARPGGGKAIAGFVLGVIGLIAWLIPIVGIVVGVLALIFGTMTTKSAHRNLAIAGIVLGSITILMSLGAFVYNVQQAAKLQSRTSTGYSSSVQEVTTSAHAVLNALTTPRN